MFNKRIRKQIKKTAITCLMATTLTATSVCTDGFGIAVHEMVKVEADATTTTTEDGFVIMDGAEVDGVLKNDVLVEYKGEGGYIVIPDEVREIDCNVFKDNDKITSVTIGKNVQKIHNSAFENCNNLKTVSMAEGINTIGPSAFKECDNLVTVNIPDSVEVIEYNAFLYCGLKSVKLPDKLKMLGYQAFLGNASLKDIEFPSTFWKVEIGRAVFRGTKWMEDQKLKNPMVCIDGILLDGQACVGDVEVPSTVKEIVESCFQDADITGIKIPDTVSSIGAGAFADCHNLKNISLTKNITEIEKYTFAGCGSLESIVIPNKVKRIGIQAFSDTAIKSIIIPNGVEEIGASAFSHSALESITIPESVVKIGNDASTNYEYKYLGDNPFFETNIKEIKGYPNTEAEKFAKATGIPFVIYVEPTAAPTVEPTQTPCAEPSPTASASTKPSPTVPSSQTPSPAPSSTVPATTTPSPAPSSTVPATTTPSPVPSPTVVSSTSPAPTQTATASAIPTESPVPTGSAIETPIPIATESVIPSNSPIPTEAVTPTPVPENESTPVLTPTIKFAKSKYTIGAKEKVTIKLSKGKAAAFSSQNTKIATVNQNGVVTAKKAGTVTITAFDANGAKVTCTIIVKKAPTYIKTTFTKKTVKRGNKVTLKVKFSAGAYSNKVTFTSSNKKVATVNAKGVITAKKKGKTTITVKTYNGKKTKVVITVK